MVKKKNSFVARFFSFILSIILIALLVGSVVYMCVSKLGDKETVSKIVAEMDFDDIKIDGKTMTDYYYEEIVEDINDSSVSVSRHDIEIIFENDDVKKYFGDLYGDVFSYAMTGEGNTVAYPNEFAAVLRNSKSDIVAKGVDPVCMELIIASLEAGNKEPFDFSDDFSDDDMKEIRNFMSSEVKMTVLAVDLLIILLILLANKRDIKDAFCYLGISAIVAGGALSKIYSLVDEAINEAIGESSNDDDAEFIVTFLNEIFKDSKSMIYLLIGVGVLLIVVFAFMKINAMKAYNAQGNDYRNDTKFLYDYEKGYIADNNNGYDSNVNGYNTGGYNGYDSGEGNYNTDGYNNYGSSDGGYSASGYNENAGWDNSNNGL